MTSKIPQDAFAIYVRLGARRSYEAVAEIAGVSKTAIVNRAKSEAWQERLHGIERAVAQRVEAEAVETIVATQFDQLESRRRIQAAVAEVITPARAKALVSALVTAAVKDRNVGAARVLLDRVIGRARSEPAAQAGAEAR